MLRVETVSINFWIIIQSDYLKYYLIFKLDYSKDQFYYKEKEKKYFILYFSPENEGYLWNVENLNMNEKKIK